MTTNKANRKAISKRKSNKVTNPHEKTVSLKKYQTLEGMFKCEAERAKRYQERYDKLHDEKHNELMTVSGLQIDHLKSFLQFSQYNRESNEELDTYRDQIKELKKDYYHLLTNYDPGKIKERLLLISKLESEAGNSKESLKIKMDSINEVINSIKEDLRKEGHNGNI